MMIELVSALTVVPHSLHLATDILSTGAAKANSSSIASSGLGVGAGATLQTGIDRICNVVAGVGAGAGVLGIIAGGLMHTQVFHNERAPETGKHIIKNSLYGIGFMAGGPMLLKMALAL